MLVLSSLLLRMYLLVYASPSLESRTRFYLTLVQSLADSLPSRDGCSLCVCIVNGQMDTKSHCCILQMALKWCMGRKQITNDVFLEILRNVTGGFLH